MTPSRFSSRWMCAHSGRTRSCTGAARGNNRASSAAVPRGSSSSAASVPASLRPPLGKAKRAAVRLPTSVHDPRSRCSTSSGIDVPLPGIRVPLPGIDVPLPPKSMFPLRGRPRQRGKRDGWRFGDRRWLIAQRPPRVPAPAADARWAGPRCCRGRVRRLAGRKRLQTQGASWSHGRVPPRPARRRAPCV